MKDQFFVFLIRQIIVFVINFFLNIVLARYLHVEDIGTLAFFNIAISLLGFFSEPGFLIPFIQKKEEMNVSIIQGLISFFILQTIVTALNMFLIVKLPGLVLGLWHLEMATAICFFASIQSIFYSYFQKKFQIQKIALIDIVATLIHFILSVFLLVKGYGLEGFLSSLLLKTFFSAVAAFALYTEKSSLFSLSIFKIDFSLTAKGLRDGFICQGAYLLGVFRNMLTPIFLKANMGIQMVAYMDRSALFAGVPVTLLNLAAQKTALPYFSKKIHNGDDIREMTKKAIFAFSFLDKLFFVPFLIVLDPFINLVLGEKWQPISSVVIVLSIGNMLMGAPSAIFSTLLLCYGEYRKNLILSLLQIVVLFSAGYWVSKNFSLIIYVVFYLLTFLFGTTLLISSWISKKAGVIFWGYETCFSTVVSVVVILFCRSAVYPFFSTNNSYLGILLCGILGGGLFVTMMIIFEKRYMPQLKDESLTFLRKAFSKIF